MTDQEIRDWYRHQIEWYKKEVKWYSEQIEWCTKQLQRSRKEDRELREYVWSKGPLTKFDMEIYGDKYEGTETHKLLLERRRYYLRRKDYEKQLTKYEKLLAE